jgi:hypothetical protein
MALPESYRNVPSRFCYTHVPFIIFDRLYRLLLFIENTIDFAEFISYIFFADYLIA